MNPSEIKVRLSVAVDREAIEAAKDAFLKSAASAVTVLVEEDKPALCIGCGAVRKPDGEMPFDH